MNKTQKISMSFLVVGLAIIPLAYVLASDRGFVIAALIGLMAAAFGGFQLLITQPVNTGSTTKTRKFARRRL
jgi:hypothetical protein